MPSMNAWNYGGLTQAPVQTAGRAANGGSGARRGSATATSASLGWLPRSRRHLNGGWNLCDVQSTPSTDTGHGRWLTPWSETASLSCDFGDSRGCSESRSSKVPGTQALASVRWFAWNANVDGLDDDLTCREG